MIKNRNLKRNPAPALLRVIGTQNDAAAIPSSDKHICSPNPYLLHSCMMVVHGQIRGVEDQNLAHPGLANLGVFTK